MTEKDQKGFMEKLAESLTVVSEDVHMGQDSNSGLYLAQASIPLTEDKQYYVQAQCVLFPLFEEKMGLEVIYFLTSDLKKETMDEVKKAVSEVNFISPIGHFGIREDSGKLYMRFCSRLDSEKDVEDLVTDALLDMHIAMATVQSGYLGFRRVWEGQVTFEEAVEKDWLRKSSIG